MQTHPNQITPGEAFDLFYFLRNPTASATYYIRAVVYDVRTGAVLATANLTQSSTNSRLFSTTLQAPPDPTGYGRSIVSIASVYTDAGYTTKSQDYEEQEQYFLVRVAREFIGGGGVDYETIRTMVEESIQKAIKGLPKPAEPPAFPEMPFDAVFGALGALQREVNRIPKDAPDHAPILAALASIQAAIGALPEPDKVNLSPISDRIDQVIADVADMRTEQGFEADQTRAELGAHIAKAANDIATRVEGTLVPIIENQEFAFPVKRVVNKPQPQPTTVDISPLFNRP